MHTSKETPPTMHTSKQIIGAQKLYNASIKMQSGYKEEMHNIICPLKESNKPY